MKKNISIILPTFLTAAFLIMTASSASLRANDIDTSFRIILEAGPGYGWTTDTLIHEGTVRGGMSWFVRLLWKPDHRLSAGIETGWVHIAEHKTTNVSTIFGKTDMQAILKAMPMMLVFDMDLWGWDLYTGLGWYYIFASTKAFNEEVSTSQWNVGFYLSLSKKIKLFEWLSGAADVKWSSVGELGRTILSGQLYLSVTLLKW